MGRDAVRKLRGAWRLQHLCRPEGRWGARWGQSSKLAGAEGQCVGLRMAGAREGGARRAGMAGSHDTECSGCNHVVIEETGAAARRD